MRRSRTATSRLASCISRDTSDTDRWPSSGGITIRLSAWRAPIMDKAWARARSRSCVAHRLFISAWTRYRTAS